MSKTFASVNLMTENTETRNWKSTPAFAILKKMKKKHVSPEFRKRASTLNWHLRLCWSFEKNRKKKFSGISRETVEDAQNTSA